MPEFMMFLCDVEGEKTKLPPEQVQAHYARVGAWWKEHEKAGRIVAGVARRLQGTNKARTVRIKAGRRRSQTDRSQRRRSRSAGSGC